MKFKVIFGLISVHRRHECIGKVTHAFFDASSKNIVVGTEQNVIANLNAGSGTFQFPMHIYVIQSLNYLIFREKSVEVCPRTKRFQRQTPFSFIS